MTIHILLYDKSSCWITVSLTLTVTPTGLVSILFWTKERRRWENETIGVLPYTGGLKLLSDGLIGAVSQLEFMTTKDEQCEAGGFGLSRFHMCALYKNKKFLNFSRNFKPTQHPIPKNAYVFLCVCVCFDLSRLDNEAAVFCQESVRWVGQKREGRKEETKWAQGPSMYTTK